MNDEFIALLKEQLELEKRFAELDERLILALDRALEKGHHDKILVTLDGEAFSIGPPKVLPLMRSVARTHKGEFRFHREGKII